MHQRSALEEVVAAGRIDLDILHAARMHHDVVLIPERDRGDVSRQDLLHLHVVSASLLALQADDTAHIVFNITGGDQRSYGGRSQSGG